MLVKGLKTAGVYWVEDQAAQMGAALAYYALFSFAPLLVIASAVAGRVYGSEASREQVVSWVRHSISAESADAVQSLLANYRELPDGFWPWLLSLASIVIGAVGLFTQLRAALNRIWRFPRPPTRGIVAGLVQDYLLALLMVLLTSVFVLLLLASSTILTLLLQTEDRLPGENWVWRLADFLASSLLILLLFAFTYRFLSDGAVSYRHVLGGAFVSAVLFTVGKMALAFYLAHAHVLATFGPAGSLVVLLIWVYYSAQIFFFGAEVIRVRLNR
jgi:membrane protein